MRYLLLASLLMFAAGCASRAVAPAPSPPIDLAPAHALLEVGCYRCLAEAFATYDRALATAADTPGARTGAFEAAVLLALREKELGLPATPWLERASTLATEEERRYVDVVSRLPWTSAGASVDFEPDARPAARAELDTWASLPGRANSSLDEYVLVALACTVGTRAIRTDIVSKLDLTPLSVRYRLGLCGLEFREHLDVVLAAEPRFVEAHFFIGRYEMTAGVSLGAGPARDWMSRAVPPLLAAHEGLPEAPIVTIALAGLMRARTELERALALYDEALATRPTQGDALLGRTITLTYLNRHDEAIATATRMIDLGRWHVGSAYYWRAWNHYRMGQLDSAASDVASARRLMVDADVLTLAGMVAYDQKRLPDARADFTAALQLDITKCVAGWYLGLLDVDAEAWPSAVTRFAIAASCYEQEAAAARAQVDQLPVDLPEEARARQVASIDETVANSLQQAGRAYFNAAQASMRLQDRTNAGRYAQSAVRYDNVRERAEALLKSLGGG